MIASGIERLATGAHEVHALPVLLASAVAAVTMLLGSVILGGESDNGEDAGVALNVRAVMLDTAADAAAAAGVAISGAIILVAHGVYWLDPAVAIAVAAVVTFQGCRLVRSIVERLWAR